MGFLTFMMVVIVLMGVLVNNSNQYNLQKLYLKCIFILYFFYSALREATVGIDTYTYEEIFSQIAAYGINAETRSTSVELGFRIFVFLLSRITTNPQILIIVSSAIICYGFYIVIKKYSNNYMLSSLIFVTTVFSATMNVMRQYVAISFILLSICAGIEKKRIKAIIYALIAASFHYTAIFMLPFVLVTFWKDRINRKTLLFISIASVAIIPFGMTILEFVIKIFPQYERFLYSSMYSATSDISFSTIFIFILVIWLMNRCVGLIKIENFKLYCGRMVNKELIQKVSDDNPNYYEAMIVFSILFFGYIVTYFISKSFWLASRAMYYVQPSLILVIPNYLAFIKRNQLASRLVTILLITGFTLCYMYFGYGYFGADPHGLLPYMFFWE